MSVIDRIRNIDVTESLLEGVSKSILAHGEDRRRKMHQ